MKKKKILVIEDDADIAVTMRCLLKEEGYEVSVAGDGKEGLGIVRRELPDLVILDLILPGLAGEEVCREIRKDINLKNIPVIMVTAKDSDADKVIGRVIGANCYLAKPFDIDELLACVDSCIRSVEEAGKIEEGGALE